jgi:uncharacterized Fe-S cluster protein YjdI
MGEIVKKYTNGEVTVIWQPSKCTHSTICFTGLPEVFDPQKRPWVTIGGAITGRIIEQVERCPSGALSYFRNGEEKKEDEQQPVTTVEILPNGPLILRGTLKVINADGSESIKENKTAFCRCGASANKPYCDGSHVEAGFKDV